MLFRFVFNCFCCGDSTTVSSTSFAFATAAANPPVGIFGLVLSIALMAFAATLISNWIKKYKWIAWAGLLAILIVAIELIYTDIQILFL